MPTSTDLDALAEQIGDQALAEYRGGQLEMRVIAEVPAAADDDPLAAIIVGVVRRAKRSPLVAPVFIGGMRHDRIAKELIHAIAAMPSVDPPDFKELSYGVSESKTLTMAMLLRAVDGGVAKLVFCRHHVLDDDDAIGILGFAVEFYRKTLATLRAPSA